MKLPFHFVLLLIVTIVLAGCVPSAKDRAATLTAIAASSSKIPTKTPAPTPSRCKPASEGQLTRIEAGVKGIDANNSVRQAYAVKSKDYENVYFVAAKIYGEGLPEDGYGPGVWVINGDPSKPGITMSVNGAALSFSDWGDGTKSDAHVSMNDDGAREAENCAK